MKQVLIVRGLAVVTDVPAPVCADGEVLVAAAWSCISAGTELAGARAAEGPLWRRALRRPGQVRRGLEMLATKGIAHTREVVKGQLDAGRPTGYSAAGVVLEVGRAVDDVVPGDRVACAGAGYANHAEVVRVPRNLVAPVPDGVEMPDAATVTLGAIALQGLRRAEPTLGETFVVLGLGAIGQLCAQLLRANGCNVVGVDLDRGRIAKALELGTNAGLHPDDGDGIEGVARLTDGIGADGVVICAASPSDEIVSTAFRMCRKKGRVVLVGDVGLSLDRQDFYEKELDFLISTSYGPGRYERTYEEDGSDYPVSYVRWTENRNMAAYLHMVRDGHVRVGPLVSSTHPIAEAASAYAALEQGSDELIVLLRYEPGTGTEPERVVPNPRAAASGGGLVRVALVGASSFARSEHVPNLAALSKVCRVHAVVSRTGSNAMDTARRTGAAYGTTDLEQVLNDAEVDAVLISTRHDLHTPMALRALRAGKHVFVEKPLAITREQLFEVEHVFSAEDIGRVLMTGFNRRFSPYAVRIRELVRGRAAPMILDYRMNAGHLPADHWVFGPEGGGRNIGEACHVYDLFTSIVGGRVVSVDAHAIRPSTAHYRADDNFVATMTFDEGSVATLTYTALGSNGHPKEQLEIFTDGRVIVLDDYKRLSVSGASAPGLETNAPDKGHRAQLAAFVGAVAAGGDWPVPLWEQVQAMEIAFRVEELVRPERV